MKFSLTMLILFSLCGLGAFYFGTLNEYTLDFGGYTIGVAGGMITRSLLVLPALAVIIYTINRVVMMRWEESWCFLVGKTSVSRWAMLVALCLLGFFSAIFSILAFPRFGNEIDPQIFSVSLAGGAYLVSFLLFVMWNLLTKKQTPAPRTIFYDRAYETLYYPGEVLPKDKMFVFSEGLEFPVFGTSVLLGKRKYRVEKMCQLSAPVFDGTLPRESSNPIVAIEQAEEWLSELCEWAGKEAAYFVEFREMLHENRPSESPLFAWTGKTKIILKKP